MWFTYALNLDMRMLDKILYVAVKSGVPASLLQYVFITILTSGCNDGLLPLLRQFFLISSEINMFVD
jgi:hypothetical protein